MKAFPRFRFPRQALLAGGMLAMAAPLQAAGLLNDVDPNWREGEFALPAYPREADLMPINVPSRVGVGHFIDTRSLEVGKDGVVRYTVVVRSAGGAENVTREGLRCNGWSWRLYASGDGKGQWRESRAPSVDRVGDDASDWRPLGEGTSSPHRLVLARDYFCDGAAPPRDTDAALRALQGNRGFSFYR